MSVGLVNVALSHARRPWSPASAWRLRVVGLALPGVLLVASTDPVRLADALTLHWRVPTRFAYGALAALRLAPLLVAEFESIRLARRTRGVEAGRNPLAARRGCSAGSASPCWSAPSAAAPGWPRRWTPAASTPASPAPTPAARGCTAAMPSFVAGTVAVCAAAVALSVRHRRLAPRLRRAERPRYGAAGDAPAAVTTRYVALLRGINVGRARQIGMPRLREVAHRPGPRRRPHAPAQRQRRPRQPAGRGGARAATSTQAIEEEFGFDVPGRRPHRRGTGRRDRRAIRSATIATDPSRYLGHLPARAAGARPGRRAAAGRGRRVPGPRP